MGKWIWVIFMLIVTKLFFGYKIDETQAFAFEMEPLVAYQCGEQERNCREVVRAFYREHREGKYSVFIEKFKADLDSLREKYQYQEPEVYLEFFNEHEQQVFRGEAPLTILKEERYLDPSCQSYMLLLRQVGNLFSELPYNKEKICHYKNNIHSIKRNGTDSLEIVAWVFSHLMIDSTDRVTLKTAYNSIPINSLPYRNKKFKGDLKLCFNDSLNNPISCFKKH